MIYKQLKELVKSVDIKNTDGEVTRVIGVSITKNFIRSVANLNGVDLTKYNLIKKNQFACKLMSVGRDLQLPIDLYKEDYYALISSAYYVFEVLDENIILPDYLNMWFRRSETDRWVGYNSGGDVRGGISWNMFLEMQVNVPSINEQRQIVLQYQNIANKIKVNEQICEKLEATAQALYKHWFVDFEFPNEAGKPYKSSGGKMVFNEELAKEIPEGWDVKDLGNFIKITNGFAFTQEDFKINDGLPVLKISNVNDFRVDTNNVQYSFCTDKLTKYKVIYGDILITLTGSHKTQINSAVGKVAIYNCSSPSLLNQRLSKINSSFQAIIYELVRADYYRDYLLNNATGSANQANISPNLISSYTVAFPTSGKLKLLNDKFEKLREFILIQSKQNQKLTELQSLLLSRLATLEVN